MIVWEFVDGISKIILSIQKIDDRLMCENNLINCVLSNFEQYVYKNLLSKKRKKEYLYGRYVAKKSLSRLLSKPLVEIVIKNSKFGYPYSDSKYEISISHTDSLVGAIAYTKNIIMGLDIEHIDESRARDIIMVLTKTEVRYLEYDGFDVKKIIVYWSAKESISKAIKTGLTIPLQTFEISEFFEVKKSVFIIRFEHFKDICVIAFVGQSKVISIALPSEMADKIIKNEEINCIYDEL